MAIRGISHVAIGVTDMERSLRFYRDVIGLRVKADLIEELPALGGSEPSKRRGVYMGWSEGPVEPFGSPSQLFSVGTHHFSFWVDDIDDVVQRASDAGFEVVMPPAIGDTKAYGEPPGGQVKSAFLRDPDSNNVQLDQRM
jgi:catechol 2,3-dioxygenase-like lactoylglutathione lyase family enzyme